MSFVYAVLMSIERFLHGARMYICSVHECNNVLLIHESLCLQFFGTADGSYAVFLVNELVLASKLLNGTVLLFYFISKLSVSISIFGQLDGFIEPCFENPLCWRAGCTFAKCAVHTSILQL